MVEQKIVAGLSDIKAVTFECSVGDKCRARLTVPFIITTTTEENAVPTKLRIPKKCPSCLEDWISDGGESSNQPVTPEIAFVSALETVKELQAKARTRFRIFLEFEIPQTMPVLAVRGEK